MRHRGIQLPFVCMVPLLILCGLIFLLKLLGEPRPSQPAASDCPEPTPSDPSALWIGLCPACGFRAKMTRARELGKADKCPRCGEAVVMDLVD